MRTDFRPFGAFDEAKEPTLRLTLPLDGMRALLRLWDGEEPTPGDPTPGEPTPGEPDEAAAVAALRAIQHQLAAHDAAAMAVTIALTARDCAVIELALHDCAETTSFPERAQGCERVVETIGTGLLAAVAARHT